MSKSRIDPSQLEAVRVARWAAANVADFRALAKRLQSVEAAEEVLGPAALAGVPVTLERSLYNVYLAVETAYATAPITPDMPDGEEVLAELFTSADGRPSASAVNAARTVHAQVRSRLEKAEAQGRRVELLDDPAEPEPRAPTRKDDFKAVGTRPRPSLLALGRYLNQRAPELGFAPTDVLRKQQGKRAAESRPLRDARARIIAEMSDADGFNASLAQLADLFNVNRNAVAVLRDRGRALRQEDTDG